MIWAFMMIRRSYGTHSWLLHLSGHGNFVLHEKEIEAEYCFAIVSPRLFLVLWLEGSIEKEIDCREGELGEPLRRV